METFNGSVKLVAATPKTIQELIEAAIDARTYSADATKNAALKSAHKQRWQGTQAECSIRATSDFYMIDAYKGVDKQGHAVSAGWAEADFTAEPGGGELFVATQVRDLSSGFHANAINLGRRVLWSIGADCILYLDVTKR